MDFYDDSDGHGHLTALIDGEACECLTYGQLLQAADSLAAHFPRRCLIFSVCSNNLESVAGYIACLRARVVPVLVNETVGPDMLATLLNEYRPAYVWLPAAIAKRATWGREVYRYRAYVLLMTRHEARYDIHADLALLLTTSADGKPNAREAVLRATHEQRDGITSYLGIPQTERPITTLPMSYTFGLSVINSHLLRGSTVILTNRSITERAFWGQLRKHRRPPSAEFRTPTRPSKR